MYNGNLIQYSQHILNKEVDIRVENPNYDLELNDISDYENDEREQEPEYITKRQLRQVPLINRLERTIIKYKLTYTLLPNTNRYKANTIQLTRKEYPNPKYETQIKKTNDTQGIIFRLLSAGY